ncbi:MAG: glycosyltransferase [Bacteroidales bacterium]|nr:glycosyltransferase [Bacteroidales bacterium]
MLSICIPIYNYKVSELVTQIYKQCLKTSIDFEILILEDGSDRNCVKINAKSIPLQKEIKHIVNNHNSGRSAVRNQLAQTAKYEKILFLDCDSKIIDDDFLINYINSCESDVVCGGTAYFHNQYVKSQSLRLKYGLKREMTSAAIRNKIPNKSFTTNNFLISKNIFSQIKFREFLKDYGHEDSLFGFELKQNNYIIHHIDNPVLHCGIEDNDVFLTKTCKAIENLVLISNNPKVNSSFINEVKLVKTYYTIKKTRLVFLINLLFTMFEKQIKNHLIKSGNPSLFWFDFYKLAYYSTVKNHKKV